LLLRRTEQGRQQVGRLQGVTNFQDFDRYCEEHNVQSGEYGEAFALWLSERMGVGPSRWPPRT
jgi:hypothetical protein